MAHPYNQDKNLDGPRAGVADVLIYVAGSVSRNTSAGKYSVTFPPWGPPTEELWAVLKARKTRQTNQNTNICVSN